MTYQLLWQMTVEKFRDKLEVMELFDGMPITYRKAHTMHIPEGTLFLRPLREASVLYVDLILSGSTDRAWQEKLLDRIESAQILDPASKYYGNFLWYLEEIEPQDGNAGFFILSPLATLVTFRPDIIPDTHRTKILTMLQHAVPWFLHECESPALYYTNAIISSCSILYAIAVLTGDARAKQASDAFLARWIDYTRKRGWGWGENTSMGYLTVILNALQLIKHLSRYDNALVYQAMDELMTELYAWIRFHGEYDAVPSVRNYNIQGIERIPRVYFLYAGVTDDIEMTPQTLYHLMLYKDVISSYCKLHEEYLAQDSVFNRQRIFDNAVAFTWKGKHCRLGTISHFPVMRGCYMPGGGGIGWQSMPAGILVYGEGMHYLRITSENGQSCRSHPVHEQKAPTFLNVPLLDGETQPEVNLFASQNNYMALIVRRIDHLHNLITKFQDEWVFKDFHGSAEKLTACGIEWVTVRFQQCSILLGALPGLPVISTKTKQVALWIEDQRTREYLPLEIMREGKDLVVTQTLYDGDSKRIDLDSVETAWAVIVLDNEEIDPAEYLKSVSVKTDFPLDEEISRASRYAVYNASLCDGQTTVTLRFDPYDSY